MTVSPAAESPCLRLDLAAPDVSSAVAMSGVMSTPGLVIDGHVISSGRVPSAGDIAIWPGER